MKVTPGDQRVDRILSYRRLPFPSHLTRVTHSVIIYSKHCITEYNEGILLDQEGYRKGWQGIDHRVDEKGGKNQIPSGRETWGRGIWATTRMLTVVMMVTNWVCV